MVDEGWFERQEALLIGGGDAEKFGNMKVLSSKEAAIRRAYSITADILAFRRCSRQYGYFAVKGYVPAQSTQLYFGIVIHEVLDRAHRQFRGLMEGRTKGLPSDNDVESYHRTVTESLRARGIRPYSRKAEASALQYLQRFNSTQGPQLYPRVLDTEHKLKADFKDFYMHGVVDVLASAEGKPDELEIWDYKGSKKVEADSEEMKNYTFQMQVYSELYKKRHGNYPARAILCFLGEVKFEEMTVEVPLGSKSAQESVSLFEKTVEEIERRRETDDWAPPPKMPSKETCDACDIRWDCPVAKDKYPLRRP
ncbi:MAG: PD-(D/E)XK nuclease family protein [Nitrososphaerales archaeon]